MKPSETFTMMVPSVRVIFELEQVVRVPVLMVKVSLKIILLNVNKDVDCIQIKRYF